MVKLTKEELNERAEQLSNLALSFARKLDEEGHAPKDKILYDVVKQEKHFTVVIINRDENSQFDKVYTLEAPLDMKLMEGMFFSDIPLTHFCSMIEHVKSCKVLKN